jgi:hypothetical protein
MGTGPIAAPALDRSSTGSPRRFAPGKHDVGKEGFAMRCRPLFQAADRCDLPAQDQIIAPL